VQPGPHVGAGLELPERGVCLGERLLDQVFGVGAVAVSRSAAGYILPRYGSASRSNNAACCFRISGGADAASDTSVTLLPITSARFLFVSYRCVKSHARVGEPTSYDLEDLLH
jgi:hypothetical protein